MVATQIGIMLSSIIIWSMTREFSESGIRYLKKLADFKDIFLYDARHFDSSRARKSHDIKLILSIELFIEIFCQNDFADTDYSIIQNESREFESADKWINQIGIETILKGLTYIIWSNKIEEGYFLKKIKDKLVYKYLTRLSNILHERANGPVMVNGNKVFFIPDVIEKTAPTYINK